MSNSSDWARIERFVRAHGYELVEVEGWVPIPTEAVLVGMERLKRHERELERDREQLVRLKRKLTGLQEALGEPRHERTDIRVRPMSEEVRV